MYWTIPDLEIGRSRMAERLKRAERARLAHDVRSQSPRAHERDVPVAIEEAAVCHECATPAAA